MMGRFGDGQVGDGQIGVGQIGDCYCCTEQLGCTIILPERHGCARVGSWKYCICIYRTMHMMYAS